MMRYLKILIVVSLFFSCETGTETAPNESYFLKYFGNEGNQTGIDFVVNADGTFVILGNSRTKTKTTEDQQIYVAKIDGKGKLIWEKTFGGKFDEEAKDIELLPDGNMIVLANSANNAFTDDIGRDRDVLLLRIRQDGTKIDSIKQGLTTAANNVGGAPTDENACSVTVISDGYIVAGSSSIVPQTAIDKYNFMNIRFRNDLSWVTDASGLWKSEPAFFFNSGESKTVKVLQSNASFYGLGFTNENVNRPIPQLTADFDFCIYGLGPDGGSLGRIFLGSALYNEKLTSVSTLPIQLGSGYLLTGSRQNATEGDVYLVKLEPGIIFPPSLQIEKPLGISLGKVAFQSAYNYSTSLNYYVTSEKLNGTTTDIYLSKLDNRGSKIFEQVFGGIGDDLAGSVAELPGGRIALIGTMTLGGVIDGQKKIVFMKLNPEGRLAP